MYQIQFSEFMYLHSTLGRPTATAETPGEEDHAWVVVEGPSIGIYQDKFMMQQAKYKNVPGNLPWRGGRFMTLEHAKNWVQAAIVVKIGMAPARYGSFWMVFLAACVFTGVPPGGRSGCPGCPLPGYWPLPGTIQTNTHVYIYIYVCGLRRPSMGFPGLDSIGPAGPSRPAKSTNFNGNATCIHGHNFVFCSFVLCSTQLLWLMKACLAYTCMTLLWIT